jgi:zinc transport system ATP-binding protein
MKSPIISLNNVSVDFNGISVLKNHNFSIFENDFIGIIGPNGGGKTTLLKVILGLVRPSSGDVLVFGQSPQKARHMIGYVPQTNSFERDFPINVWETVLMGRLSKVGLLKNYSRGDYEIAEETLNTVGMYHLKDRQMSQLSGGECQRVLIARALTIQPKLLLLDEPTASVDPEMKTNIFELFSKLRNKMTILLVTHDIGVISSHVDKIACLNRELFFHDSNEISKDALEAVYHCPVDIIAHGFPHRVLKNH